MFKHRGDELKDRTKVLHTQGVVAQVEWIPYPNEMGLSGIYATGSDHVIMRLSETNNLTEASKGLLPGAAFKFLIDNEKSENLLAMHSMRSNWEWDFFARPMSSRIKRLWKNSP